MNEPIVFNYTPDATLAANLRLHTTMYNPEVLRSSRRNMIISVVLYIGLAGYMLYKGEKLAAGAFAIVGILFTILNPIYTQWRYKRMAQRYAKTLHGDKAFTPVQMQLSKDLVIIKDADNTFKETITGLEVMDESDNYFFIRESGRMTICVPKSALSTQQITEMHTLLNYWSTQFETPFYTSKFKEVA